MSVTADVITFHLPSYLTWVPFRVSDELSLSRSLSLINSFQFVLISPWRALARAPISSDGVGFELHEVDVNEDKAPAFVRSASRHINVGLRIVIYCVC